MSENINIEKCGGCKESFKSEDLKHSISSVRHLHPTAHKAQKRIIADICFHDLDQEGDYGSYISLCPKCQKLIMQGMYNGGMWK